MKRMMLSLLLCATTHCAGVTGGLQTGGGQMPYAQDCAVRKRPPDPDKIPVMHGLVASDGKTVKMVIADVPSDGIMQRDTQFCERAAIGGTRKTEQSHAFDLVKLTALTGATPAAATTEREYRLESLPRAQWSTLADRWPDATR
jgi:hypothetical protein